MTDTENKPQKTSHLDSFAKQQGTRGNDVTEQAQRLVNLYRHAALLGDDFSEKFDQMLLSVSSEVLTTLNDIIGGPTVRRYYDYLKEKTIPQNTAATDGDSDTTDTDVRQTGYLPSPDKDIPLQTQQADRLAPSTQTADSLGLEAVLTHIGDLHRIEAEKQNAFLQQALENLIRTQTEVLTQALQNLAIRTSSASTDNTASFYGTAIPQSDTRPQYSDIIEEAVQTTAPNDTDFPDLTKK